MKAIKKSLCFVLAVLATVFTARAADPVAVWSGKDLNGTTQGGITLNLNGNTYGDGAITISSSKGVLLNNANANVCSVIIEYENFNTTASAKQTLFTLQKNGGEDNNIGVYWNTTAKLHGIYKNSSWDNGGPGDYTANAIPTSGRLGFGYNKSENGVTVYAGDVTVYDADGLKEGGSTYTGVSIGGYRGTTAIGAASNMKITAIAFFTSKLSASDAAAYEFPSNSTGPQLVWEGNSATANKTLSKAVEKGKPFTLIVNMTNTDSSTPAGSYIINKINPGQIITPFCIATESFTGFNTSGNVPNSCVSYYEKKSGGFWVGVGSRSNSGNATWNEEKKGDDVSAYDSIYVAYSGNVGSDGQVANYVRMIYAHNKNTDQYYTLSSTSASLTISDSLDTMNVNSSADALSFKVYLDNTQRTVDGIKQAIENIINPPASIVSATISENSTWADLWSDENPAPTASQNAVLTVETKATLTLDETTAFKSLKLVGSADLTIAGLDSANVGLIQKIKLNEFTGKLRYEFDASAGLTADQTLLTFIRTASEKTTFSFKGSGNKGAALGYGFVVNAAIHSHIVFDGGTHTMSYGYGGSGADGNLFGVNANNSNPTVLVTGNATLNFTAKDISYWSGDSDIGGVIRVNDGATLNLLQNGSDTFFYRQRLWLDPGSLTTFNFSAKDQGAGTESCFRFNGGAVQNKEQIYVPESATDMVSKPAVIKQLGAGALHLASDNTRGLAIFVGAKSKLRLETPITTGGNNPPFIKYGTGVLETIKSITTSSFTFTEGTFASSSTVNKLAIGQDVAFDISDGAPTITDTFSAQSKQLKLAIKEPTHMMDVITLPAGTDMTGWTAVVNGNTANPCELVADGTTLKLKWKIPPTIEVEADDVTIETADDWNGGVVKVGLDGLNVGDYEGDIRYLLRFGDKVVDGSVANGVATFELGANDFTAGNIYRGTFELEYGTGNAPIAAAEVTVYAGEKTYGVKEGWINESATAFKSTGSYDPEQGASVAGDFIKFSNPTDVVFTPTNSPADYVAKCDSEITFEIFSGEEAISDDDDTVADDLQAGVKIVDNGSGGVKFQFISGDAWIDGPTAALNTTYAVTVNFHYAKEEGDSDSVTYTVESLMQKPVVANRRANTAEKLETISFADGTQISSLVGKCEIEVADPIEKGESGMAPGEDEKELKATDEATAQAEAEKIPVLVPSEVESGLTEGLDDAAAAKAKADYKAHFKVVAQKNASGKFVAIVMPTGAAETKAEAEVQKVSADVLTEVTALTGGETEGTATISEAVPGFFYGVAENGEVVNMKTAEPNEWKMAGASGKVELKVTKPANAKQRFYKILCSPLPKK